MAHVNAIALFQGYALFDGCWGICRKIIPYSCGADHYQDQLSGKVKVPVLPKRDQVFTRNIIHCFADDLQRFNAKNRILVGSAVIYIKYGWSFTSPIFVLSYFFVSPCKP